MVKSELIQSHSALNSTNTQPLASAAFKCAESCCQISARKWFLIACTTADLSSLYGSAQGFPLKNIYFSPWMTLHLINMIKWRAVWYFWCDRTTNDIKRNQKVKSTLPWADFKLRFFIFLSFLLLTSCQLFSMLCSGNVTRRPLQSHREGFPRSFHPVEKSNSRFYLYQWSNISLKTEHLKRKKVFLSVGIHQCENYVRQRWKMSQCDNTSACLLGASWQASGGFTCEQTQDKAS